MRFEDLRDKEVEESGVGWVRRHGSIASVHEYIVPGGGKTMGFRGSAKIFTTLNISQMQEIQECSEVCNISSFVRKTGVSR